MEKVILFAIAKSDFDVEKIEDCGVKILHKGSGAVGESVSENSLEENKNLAFARTVTSPQFAAWQSNKLAQIAEHIYLPGTDEEPVGALS